eukprot:SAG11_NODE_8254_length_1039_cov_1.497872_1_plen_312_part_00
MAQEADPSFPICDAEGCNYAAGLHLGGTASLQDLSQRLTAAREMDIGMIYCRPGCPYSQTSDVQTECASSTTENGVCQDCGGCITASANGSMVLERLHSPCEHCDDALDFIEGVKTELEAQRYEKCLGADEKEQLPARRQSTPTCAICGATKDHIPTYGICCGCIPKEQGEHIDHILNTRTPKGDGPHLRAALARLSQRAVTNLDDFASYVATIIDEGDGGLQDLEEYSIEQELYCGNVNELIHATINLIAAREKKDANSVTMERDTMVKIAGMTDAFTAAWSQYFYDTAHGAPLEKLGSSREEKLAMLSG